MKHKRLAFILIIVSFSILINACKKDEEKEGGENESKISSYSSSESHNNGQNCMTCHVSGGGGEGYFIVAGSVYDESKTNPLAGATVKLYTGPNGSGDLKATLQVDKKGNFYTTSSVDFGSGLYPAVQGATTTMYMNSTISKGHCNSCHGNTTSKIWTK